MCGADFKLRAFNTDNQCVLLLPLHSLFCLTSNRRNPCCQDAGRQRTVLLRIVCESFCTFTMVRSTEFQPSILWQAKRDTWRLNRLQIISGCIVGHGSVRAQQLMCTTTPVVDNYRASTKWWSSDSEFSGL